MQLREDLYIGHLHYVLKFNHYQFSFYLIHPPKALTRQHYKNNPALALFRDDPIYEDVQLQLPARKILQAIAIRIEQLVRRYRIQYWSFTATSIKKANVYDKLLQRWLKQTRTPFRYERFGLDFCIYPINEFS